MSAKFSRPELEALRSKLALAERSFAHGAPAFFLGAEAVDGVVRAGLARGALHEVYPRRVADAPPASAFALALAIKAAGLNGKQKPILWVRQDFIDTEMGALNGAGLMEFGLDPSRLILVRARDVSDVLRAGEDAARCSSLGAVIMEPWGDSKSIDLTATRRLGLAAGDSGVTVMLARPGARPVPSTADTRWSVAGAASQSPGADAPGRPAFNLSLLRHRGGSSERTWTVEWDRDAHAFADAPLSVGLVPPVADRPVAAGQRSRAG